LKRPFCEGEAMGRSPVTGREEDEAAWLGWAARAEEGGAVAAWLSAGGRRKPGGAHTVVRGEGGGGLGWPEAKSQWGGRPAAGPGRRRRPKRGGGGVGQEEGRGRAQGGEMGSGPAKGQGPRGWWAGPEAADEQ
jgi:hypothetical protein